MQVVKSKNQPEQLILKKVALPLSLKRFGDAPLLSINKMRNKKGLIIHKGKLAGDKKF